MTSIDTLRARLYWTEQGKTEVDYLEAIQYIAQDKDLETGFHYISLSGDEECNRETKLTPKAARWLAEKLIEYAADAENKNNKGGQKNGKTDRAESVSDKENAEK